MFSFLSQFGVLVGALTGVLAARGKRVDLFGVIVLAFVTAVGGGTIRDLVLGIPVFWIHESSYLVNATLTAIVTFYLVRFHELPYTFLMVADAFALALFTTIGAQKGLAAHASPSVAVCMGVITGVAGGILRDLLIGEIPLVFQPQICLYATAAIGGATLFVLFDGYLSSQLQMIIGTAATLSLRLAGIRWRIALPMFRPKTPVGEVVKSASAPKQSQNAVTHK